MTETPEDEVFSLDEVFNAEADEVVRLVLTDDEWEIIIYLAEKGGEELVENILEKSPLDSGRTRELLGRLEKKGIIARGVAEKKEVRPEESLEDISTYLEELSGKNHYQHFSKRENCHKPFEHCQRFLKIIIQSPHNYNFFHHEQIQINHSN